MYPRRSKFGNTKTVVDGHKYDSKKESKRGELLKFLERRGEISELQFQVRIEIIPKHKKNRKIDYVADFVYKDKDGKIHYEDSKGFRTEVYKLKKKLLSYLKGIEIEEV